MYLCMCVYNYISKSIVIVILLIICCDYYEVSIVWEEYLVVREFMGGGILEK